MDQHTDTFRLELQQLQHQLEQVTAERDALAERLRSSENQANGLHCDDSTSLQQWLKVIDAIQDPIFVHDPRFRILLANQAYADIAGVTLDQVRGRPYWELFPKASGPMKSCVRALSLQCEQHEEILLENGQVYTSRAFPVRDRNDKYISSVHVFHNVTETRLLKSRAHIQDEALQHSAEAVLILDNRLQITYVNPAFCKMFGYEKDQLLGQSLSLISGHDDSTRRDHNEVIDYIRNHDATWTGKTLRKARNGDNISVYLSASAIKDEDGNIIGFVKNYLDLRAVNRATEQLQTLHSVIEDLSTRLDLDAVGSSAIRAAVDLLGSDMGFICLIDESDNRVYHHWHVGLPEDTVRSLLRPYDLHEGLTGRILASGRPKNLENYAEYEHAIDEYRALGIRSVLGVPIIIDEQIRGVMFVGTINRPVSYSPEQVSFLEGIARQMGVGLQRKQLIADLEQSRKDLNHIIDTVPDVIYQARPLDFSTPFVSKAVTAILGYSPEDFTQDPTRWQREIHEDDAERVFSGMTEAFESGAPSFTIEYRIRHRDGKSYRWMEDRGTIERDSNNQPVRVFGSASDITERKNFQRKLEDSQARYSDLFNNIKSGVAVYRAVDDGNDFVFVDFNSAAERIEQLQKDRIIGRSLLDVFPAIRDVGLLEALKRVWQTGQSEYFPVFFYEDSRISGWRESTLYRLKTGEVVAVYDDITERKQAEYSLARLNRALKTLSQCNHTLVHAQSEQDLLESICQNIYENGGYPMSCVCYTDEQLGAGRLKPIAHFGIEDHYLEALPGAWRDDAAGNADPRSPELIAINTRAPYILHSIPKDDGNQLWVRMAASQNCHSLICLPIIDEGAAIGALTIFGKEASAFDEDEIKLLTEMAGDLAYGILTLRSHDERKRLAERERFSNQRLQDSLVSTIQAIATSMEKRDPYTAGHQRKVADLATAIAERMGLPQEQIDGLRLGALIHDIGKIYVPAEILNRPGNLTPAEFEIIKSHPEVGYEIMKGVDFPWPVNEMVLQHHERLDGSGYPHGLRGDDIALEARILAVADVVEAMASHRPYRPGLGQNAALKELQSHRGTLYDARAVDVCIELFTSHAFEFARASEN